MHSSKPRDGAHKASTWFVLPIEAVAVFFVLILLPEVRDWLYGSADATLASVVALTHGVGQPISELPRVADTARHN